MGMDINSIFSLANYALFHLYFPVLWLVYFYKRLHKENINSIFKVSWISYIAIVIITVSGGAWLLYQGWAGSAVFSYLLPPQSNYFYLVVFRTLLFHLISIALGIILYYLIKLIVKLAKAGFIELFEIKLLALGAVLAGWSNLIVYFAAISAMMLGASVFINLFKSGRGQRVQLAPYVLLALIFTLLIGYKFSAYFGLY